MKVQGNIRARLALIVGLLGVSVALTVALSGARKESVSAAEPPPPAAVNGSVASLESAFESVAENVGKSVVTVSVRMKTPERMRVIPGPNPFQDEEFFKDLPPQFREFFRGPRGNGQFRFYRGPDGKGKAEGPDPEEKPEPPTPKSNEPSPFNGSGSGLVLRADGHILTNAHVVRNAEEVAVQFSDGTVAKAKVVGRDDLGDLAVIKAETKKAMTPSTLGDSDRVRVGQFAVAVGTPMGMKGTVSVGIVSGVNRTLAAGTMGRSSLIQTDAHITFGNSGGPLCNLRGEVIGINAMITREGGIGFGDANSGFGFAIPINEAKRVADQLISHGKVSRGYLGIMPTELTPQSAERVKCDRGVLVQEVRKDTPAEKSGVKKDDVIQQVDGKDVRTPWDLQAEVRKHVAGDRVKLSLMRDGKPMDLSVTLADLPLEAPPLDDKSTAPKPGPTDPKLQPREKPNPSPEPRIEKETKKPAAKPAKELIRGLGVQELDASAREYYKLGDDEKGALVSVVEDGGAAATAGIEVGDVIKEVNRAAVTSGKDFEKEARAAGSKPLMLLVKRDGKTKLVTVK